MNHWHLAQGGASTPRYFARGALLAAIIASSALGACAASSGPGDAYETAVEQSKHAPFSPKQAKEVIAEGYAHITGRYIEPVKLNDLALDGLNGIKSIDPDVMAKREGSDIRVFYDGREVYAFNAASISRTHPMSTQTVNAIQAVQKVSKELGARDRESIYTAFFDGMIAPLDSFTRYSNPDETRDNRADREGYPGIGIRIQIVDDAIEVGDVLEDGPAAEAGLKPRDRITHVEGKSVAGLDLRDAVSKLRGPSGSKVRITVDRPGEDRQINLVVRRAHVIWTSVEYTRMGDIGYFKLTRFNQATSHDLREQLEAMHGESMPVRGIVLDMRNNPGGLLDQAIEVSDIFLDDGLIIQAHGRHSNSHQRYEAGGIDHARGLPMVVLINEHSASAAEIVAAALQDNNRAILLGTTSFGKGTVQQVFPLPNNGEITLTWSRFYAPSGYVMHGLGILPTVCTNDHSLSPDALVRSIENNRGYTKATFADWRASRTVDDPDRAELRKICPPLKEDAEETAEDYEIIIARRLLADRALYSATLSVAGDQLARR